MSKTPLLTVLFVFISALIGGTAMAQSEQPATPTPKVIIFDVNETLLDLTSMRASVGKALGGRDELLPLWFSTMLHNSLVTTTTGDYHDFGQIGVASLLMVAQNNNIELSAENAKTAIVEPLLSLPAHPDVKSGLQSLKAQGFKIVSLTNSSNNGVKTQFANAGLTDYFDNRYSIEDIQIYKPDLRAYHWALEQLGIEPQEALMVAAHGWDIAGAAKAGLQTAFVARPGKALYPLAQKPDYIVNNIQELAAIFEK
ncbi:MULTISPECIES: haloacid dehalogenase type II [unclassified Gilvimarinus]|uniref:haloacid dehalogenase type II n=1 Tax=unclassified Gilvimarinus TaxID=2642066 RepID=UPI0026E38193|nr:MULTISPECIES: haloacid dehalogenase type II [unclassified Gilvimarinus]MDO6572102.1 haloacid dehalogenase type II [Gilvimarinus sp. 2_MG-2023]MDO6746163.1 haloacid dehalogenase type II [Gilvimarinus sp. 1_MG-2023]